MAKDDISQPVSIETIRAGLAGAGRLIDTPFGPRPLVYADYTASGRAYGPIEAEIAALSEMLANPHTQDSATGRASNAALARAEAAIRRAINAGPNDAVIPCGTGATGAIHKLQEILGVAIPPASRARMLDAAETALGARARETLEAEMKSRAPVIFIGPYEHHANELSWREGLAEIVPISLCPDGGINFDQLEAELQNPVYKNRLRIGAFSAASNVTGIKTDTARLARLLHAHDAILCLDAAASAPYLAVDMNPAAAEERIDAVYLSPHKFVGGPGSAGILAFNKSLYPHHLAPTVSAGGTVRYVWRGGHDFIEDVEAREKAGTPGLPQIMRAALALELRDRVGLDVIAAREHAALTRAFARWTAHPGIEILGPADPERRIGIVSFNIRRPDGEALHPRLVTTLLSDLFGIQARAGCACAGPYAHDLLGLGETEARAYRKAVLAGHAGLRPGWSRVSLHWSLSDAEIDYLIEAVAFIAEEGWRFVDLYRFDLEDGAWNWTGEARRDVMLGSMDGPLEAVFAAALTAARERASQCQPCERTACLPQSVEPLRDFALPVQ